MTIISSWPECEVIVKHTFLHLVLHGEGHDVLVPRSKSCPVDGVRSEVVPVVDVSFGTAAHFSRNCKPCAWRWKVRGCSNGSLCRYCHLCEDGAVKQAKWEKAQARKHARKQAAAIQGLPNGIPFVPALLQECGCLPVVVTFEALQHSTEPRKILAANYASTDSTATSQGNSRLSTSESACAALCGSRPWARGSFQRRAMERAAAK